MRDTYSVAEAQSRLPRLLRAAEGGEPVRIRRRDKTVAYLVSRERMEAIAETLEILANPEAMRIIGQHRRGKLKMFPLSALGDD